jgi:hypothetical protein
LGLAAVLGAFAIYGLAMTGPLVGGAAGWVTFAGLWSTAIPATILSVISGWGPLPGLLCPLVYPVIPITVLNSLWTTFRNGGVRWRGTLYPIDRLRRDMMR